MARICPECGALICPAVTIHGYPIPLDPRPSEHGMIRLAQNGSPDVLLAVHVPLVDRGDYLGQLYDIHRCPAGRVEHRRRRPEPDSSPRWWGD